MEIIEGLDQISRPPDYPVVALGNFDGVHLGHRALVRSVVERARSCGGTSLVITFKPHPLKVLAPEAHLRFLATESEKESLLGALEVDRVVYVPFDRAFSRLSPEAFAEAVLHERLRVREVFVGDGFSFGRDRSGTVGDLERFGSRLGYGVRPVRNVEVDGKPVSSSRIRGMLIEGRVREAATLLGRIYSIEGKVSGGKREASGLGFPTANLEPPADRVIPADGVYAAWGILEGKLHKGVAYIGTQPTLGPRDRTMELHLFESFPDLYGKTLRIGFQDYIREERVFSDPGELAGRIAEDIAQARDFLREEPTGNLLVLPASAAGRNSVS